ncbi:HEAT repeat domain-containing protein [Candidatus Uabimicrobium sp. HlEnr_7]|uniref:HEAT repeat domain-containing protein n=1 Tax=Candidatus Uabimicrobium helgolandensis TaxID=3095367 RepID=UPI0035573D47
MENKWRYPTFVTGIATFIVFLVNIVPMLVWDSIHDISIFIGLFIISSFLITMYARSLKRNTLFWGLFNLASIGLAAVILLVIDKNSIKYIPPKSIYEQVEAQESVFRVYNRSPKIKIPKEITKCPPITDESVEKIKNILQKITDPRDTEKTKLILEIGAGAIPILAKHLQSNNKTQEIFTILYDMKSDAYPIIPYLVDFIEQDQHMQDSISVLGSIGNKSAITIPILSHIIKNTSVRKNIRAKAVEVLGDIGELPKDLYQLLILCCKEAPRQIATNAVRVLGKLAPYSKDLEDFLLHMLQNNDMTHAVVEALQCIGSLNIVKNSTFQNLLINQKDNIQKASENTLMTIIRKEGVDTAALENPKLDDKIKLKITILFLKQEPNSKYLFSIVEQNYKSKHDVTTKKIISQVLDSVTSESTAAISLLLKLFRDPNKDIRKIAVDKLSSIGSKATEAIPALRKMVYDKDAKIQVMAVEVLINILTTKDDLFKFLTTTLRNKTSEVRIVSARTLAKMSPNIAFAIPDLEKALSDDVADVKNAAQEALDSYEKTQF